MRASWTLQPREAFESMPHVSCLHMLRMLRAVMNADLLLRVLI